MRFLTVVFSSHKEFLAHFSDKYPNGALFCSTKAKADLQAKVIVDISFPGLRQPTRLCGQVISHSSIKGMWICFNNQSRASAQHLCQWENLEASRKLSRAHSRYPASLNVRCNIQEVNPAMDSLSGTVVDLSQGGAFISGNSIPMIGTRISLDIGPLAYGTRYKVDGRVAWVGSLDSQKGFGVRFDRRSKSGTRPLRTMLRRASESGKLRLD